LSGRARYNRSDNGNRSNCDISQLSHVAPLRLTKRPGKGGVPRLKHRWQGAIGRAKRSDDVAKSQAAFVAHPPRCLFRDAS
jgi:hypothetical protein